MYVIFDEALLLKSTVS